MKKSEEHFLYIVQSDQFAKVGISSNLVSRMASFESFNPVEVKLVKVVKYHNKKSALMCEKELHRILKSKNYHIKFEWFLPFNKVFHEFVLFQKKFNPEFMKEISDDLALAKNKLDQFLNNPSYSKKVSHVLRFLEKKFEVPHASNLMRSIINGKAINMSIATQKTSSLIQEIIDDWAGD